LITEDCTEIIIAQKRGKNNIKKKKNENREKYFQFTKYYY